MTDKARLDKRLVELGLAPTPAKAQALVMAGVVVVDDHAAQKPGQLVSAEAHIRLKGEHCPYVSRGGLKLEAALRGFSIDPSGWVCVDVGASTGGFTDCLLQHGAARVYAVDVGYGQLAWSLREDARVVNLERVNFRNLEPATIGEPADLVVADASFISLTLLLPPIRSILKQGGQAVVLVKPQFEVDKGQVEKGGVVRDEALRKAALDKVCHAATIEHFEVLSTMESPIAGAKKGNLEFLAHLKRT